MAISKKQLIIGLDLGTAFSKVVIGDKHVRYAVPFTKYSSAANQYLVATALHVGDNNLCYLSPASNTSSASEGVKLVSLENNFTNEDNKRLTAYLALVFRSSTHWLLQRYKKRYARSELIWSINASLPVTNVADEKSCQRYQQILHTAWILSVLPGPITFNRVAQYATFNDNAFDAFPSLYKSKIISKQSIQLFSEYQAHACACVNSTQAEDTLFMLIDVGTSRINISTFIKSKNANGKKTHIVYFYRSETIGVNYLLAKRYESLQLPLKNISMFEDVPSNADFSHANELTEKDIRFADTIYSGEVSRLISQTLDHTRKQCFPDLESWPKDVATFVMGGGAQTEVLQTIIQCLENKSPPRRISSVKLVVPEDLMTERYAENLFGRLSLAYGLSFSADVIHSCILQKIHSENDETIKV